MTRLFQASSTIGAPQLPPFNRCKVDASQKKRGVVEDMHGVGYPESASKKLRPSEPKPNMDASIRSALRTIKDGRPTSNI
jgi:hypothetical protein